MKCMDLILRGQGFANQLDQYALLRELGTGGSSKVVLAQHRSTNETYAMKIIELENIS